MSNDELFSGIPSLDDEAGLENYMNTETLGNLGFGSDNTPAALQTQDPAPAPAPAAAPTQEPTPAAPATPAAPQYTADQIAQIIARNQQLEAQMAQNNVPQRAPQTPQSAYTPQQANIIKQLIDKGVSLDRIQAALQGRTQNNAAQAQLAARLANLEGYLQNQQYIAAQNEFVDKMNAFGGKFGLSEADLVTFGNKAMSMGINLTEVSDVEAVFRAVYPEQYAIRSQRISGNSSSQIYGGSAVAEATRASAAKLEDAYVDQFLRNAMPNQYGMYAKK